MWVEIDNKLMRELRFSTHEEALAFVVRVTMLAEKENHHPDIYFTHSKVLLSLTTHSAGNKVTQKDRDMGLKIDALLG